MDILRTPTGRTQPVRTKSLQKQDMLATFERQMADYMQATGERIRAAREALFSTRREAQDETGLSEKQWYRWEKGLSEPTASNWRAIEEALGVDVATLRGDPPKMLDPESKYQAQLDRIEANQQTFIAEAAALRVELGALASQLAGDIASTRVEIGTLKSALEGLLRQTGQIAKTVDGLSRRRRAS